MAKLKKKARATKGAGPELSDTGVQEGNSEGSRRTSEPRFECPIELPISSSQQPAETLVSEEVPFKSDELDPQDCSITITIPGGVISKEEVQYITDGIRVLVQDEERQYNTYGS